MKTIVRSMVLGLALFSTGQAFCETAETAATNLLAAYKGKDAATVKKYAPPIIMAAVNEKYFEDKSVKKEVEALQKWDGKIREVRYTANKFAVMAIVYFNESDKKDRIKILTLSKAGKDWKQFGGGFDETSKKDFSAYAAEEPSGKTAKKEEKAVKTPADALKSALPGFGFGRDKEKGKKTATADENSANKGYDIETADGTKAKNPSVKELKKLLSALNDDNFFLTLNGPGGFMQAGYTDKGLDMQYKDSAGHFAGKTPADPETAAAMFSSYLTGGTDWKTKCEWKPFE